MQAANTMHHNTNLLQQHNSSQHTRLQIQQPYRAHQRTHQLPQSPVFGPELKTTSVPKGWGRVDIPLLPKVGTNFVFDYCSLFPRAGPELILPLAQGLGQS